MGILDRLLNRDFSKKETTNKPILGADEIIAGNESKKRDEQKTEIMKNEEEKTIDSNKEHFQKKDDEKKELYQKQDLEKKDQLKKDDEKKSYEDKLWQQRVANDAKDVRSNSNDKISDLSKESYEEKKKEIDEHLSKLDNEKTQVGEDKKTEESKTLSSYKENGLLKTTEHYNIHGARDQQEYLSKENSIFERRQSELEAASKNQNLSPEKQERASLVKDAEYHDYQSEQYSRVIEYEKTAAGFAGKEREPNEYDKQLNHHKEQANEAAQKLHDFDKQHKLVNDKCQAVADTPEFKRGRTVDPQEQQRAINYLKNLDINNQNQKDFSQTKEKEQAATADRSSYKASFEPQNYNQNAAPSLNKDEQRSVNNELENQAEQKKQPLEEKEETAESKDKSEVKSKDNDLTKNESPNNAQSQSAEVQGQEKAPEPPAPEPAPAQTPPPPAPEYGYGGY